MFNVKLFVVILLAAYFLSACQTQGAQTQEVSKEDPPFSDSITSIEIYGFQNGELVSKIEDKKFIKKLIGELNEAETAYTGTMDFEDPDYRLRFQQDEKTVFQLGYFKEMMELGVNGHYLDYENEYLYEGELKLRVE